MDARLADETLPRPPKEGDLIRLDDNEYEILDLRREDYFGHLLQGGDVATNLGYVAYANRKQDEV